MTSRKTTAAGSGGGAGNPQASTPQSKDTPQSGPGSDTEPKKPQRLDQRLKNKLKALRGRTTTTKKDEVTNDSQKRTSLSKRKKNICSTETRNDNRTTITTTTTTDNRTRENDTVTTDDAIPYGTPAWKTKRIEELGKGDVIFGKRWSCRLGDLICIEEHGRVYKAFSTKQIEGTPVPKRDKEDAVPLAVKTDIATGSMKKWFNTEKDVLLSIATLRPSSIADHFPQIFDSGELYFFRYIMMSLHGPNIERLRKDILKSDFSTSTAVRIGYQTLTAIVDLHFIGYLHRDLKPTNFVIGMDTGSEYYLRSTNLRVVYMVGFGTCIKKKEVHDKSERRFVNLTFGSRKSHNLAHALDKNDDLESWLYLCIELFKRGSLPWRRKGPRAEIVVQKQKFFDDLGFPGLYDFTPDQFKTIIQKGFVEIPEGKSVNTQTIQTVFRDISRRLHIAENLPFEWEPSSNGRFGKPPQPKDNLMDDVPPPMRVDVCEGVGLTPVKKVPKASTPKNTTGTTTTTEDDDDEKEKQQESTNLDESASVMLRRVVFDKNSVETNTTEEHSCSSLDPAFSQAFIKSIVDREVQTRSKIPKAIPPDDPLLKLTLNKSRNKKGGLISPGPPADNNGRAIRKPPTNRNRNVLAANNNNKKKNCSEDKSTTTEDK